MTVLFAGTEVDAFDGQLTAFVTSTGYFDPTYTRGAMNFIPSTPNKGIQWAPVTDTWLRFSVRVVAGLPANAYLSLIDATGQGVVRFGQLSNSTLHTLEYYNGSSWVALGTVQMDTDNLATYDVQFLKGVSGRIAAYANDRLVIESLGDYSALPDVVNLSIVNRSSSPFNLSQIIVADEPTIGFKLAYRQPTGAGNYTAWTGTFAEVAAAVPVTTSNISSSVNGQRESFTKAIFSVPVGLRVKAVGGVARARRGSTGPSKLALSLRFGSTDYDSADKNLALGFAPVEAFWHTNPATGLEWTPADAGSVTVEFGVKAVT